MAQKKDFKDAVLEHSRRSVESEVDDAGVVAGLAMSFLGRLASVPLDEARAIIQRVRDDSVMQSLRALATERRISRARLVASLVATRSRLGLDGDAFLQKVVALVTAAPMQGFATPLDEAQQHVILSNQYLALIQAELLCYEPDQADASQLVNAL